MTARLVTRQFRHLNGGVARGVNIQVVLRGSSTVLADLVTDQLGTASLYLEPGQYDWLALGYRFPFDVEDLNVEPFIHNQTSPAATWTITHGRGTKPDVAIFLDDDLTERVWADLSYPDLSTVVVQLPSASSGKAFIP